MSFVFKTRTNITYSITVEGLSFYFSQSRTLFVSKGANWVHDWGASASMKPSEDFDTIVIFSGELQQPDSVITSPRTSACSLAQPREEGLKSGVLGGAARSEGQQITPEDRLCLVP